VSNPIIAQPYPAAIHRLGRNPRKIRAVPKGIIKLKLFCGRHLASGYAPLSNVLKPLRLCLMSLLPSRVCLVPPNLIFVLQNVVAGTIRTPNLFAGLVQDFHAVDWPSKIVKTVSQEPRLGIRFRRELLNLTRFGHTGLDLVALTSFGQTPFILAVYIDAPPLQSSYRKRRSGSELTHRGRSDGGEERA
jgi:hypothetical protein